MTRLREQQGSPDALEAACAKLVASEESVQTAAMKQRVRAELLAPPHRIKRRAWVLHPAMMIVILLGLVSIAAAMVGRLFNERAIRREAAPTVAPAASVAPVIAPLAIVPAVPTPAVPTPVMPTPAAPTAIPTPSVSATPRPPRAQLRAAEEAKLMITGVRLLRVDHDFARASALFEGYLRHYPKGALYEEALAYAIEAARAQGAANTGTLASEYLARFPEGRFHVLAERAKKRFEH